jgi:hypothetical protein
MQSTGVKAVCLFAPSTPSSVIVVKDDFTRKKQGLEKMLSSC